MVRLMDQREGEDLWRLYGPEQLTIWRVQNNSVLYLLDRIFDGHRCDSCLILHSGMQSRLDDCLADQWTCTIMDHHPLTLRLEFGQGIQATAYRILAASTTGNDGAYFGPRLLLTEFSCILQTFRAGNNN